MKKIFVFAIFLLAHSFCIAAQQPVSPVAEPGNFGEYRADQNTNNAATQANFTELYGSVGTLTSALNGKASISCFANSTTAAACGIDLDWLATGVGDNLGSATSSNITALFSGAGDCLGANGQKVACGTGSSGIPHATSDGNYYGSRNGAWVNLAGVFAAPLGFTPENAANKGAANGYAGLGSDGKVPSSQLPPSTGTDDQTATEVPATPWSSYTGTNVQALMQEVDTALRAMVSGAALPSWMPSVGPTNGRQILQATGGCTLSAYDNRADCQANSGTWTTPTYQHTSVISGLINDTGTADDDLWSAAKITSELAGKQASLGYTPENAANKGAANGYAGLGNDGKVPTAQLPTLGTTYGLPSLADAQAGTSTTAYVWSPQRVAQAIVALAPSGGAAEGYYEIDGGSSTSITFTGDIDGGASI